MKKTVAAKTSHSRETLQTSRGGALSGSYFLARQRDFYLSILPVSAKKKKPKPLSQPPAAVSANKGALGSCLASFGPCRPPYETLLDNVEGVSAMRDISIRLAMSGRLQRRTALLIGAERVVCRNALSLPGGKGHRCGRPSHL